VEIHCFREREEGTPHAAPHEHTYRKGSTSTRKRPFQKTLTIATRKRDPTDGPRHLPRKCGLTSEDVHGFAWAWQHWLQVCMLEKIDTVDAGHVALALRADLAGASSIPFGAL